MLAALAPELQERALSPLPLADFPAVARVCVLWRSLAQSRKAILAGILCDQKGLETLRASLLSWQLHPTTYPGGDVS